MKRVYLLYGLSGLVSLGYQVAWFRIYVDWFGSTNLTFAMVLCNFIGGLGLGALASRPVADGLARRLSIQDRLRVYGVVELLVALSVLFVLLARLVPADAWGSFPYVLRDGIHVPRALPQLSKLALAGLCVFVPCFFMGVTFPLLCQVYGERGRFPSALYGWNTLGACSGVLLCEFVLLPRVGHDRALWLLVLVNLLLGAFFLATGGAPRSARGAPAPDAVPVAQPPRSGAFGVLLACAILSGLLAGALEADMFKRVSFLSNASPAAMSFISFWAIVAIFLASFAVRVAARLQLAHIKVAFVLALLVYAATWHFAHPIRTWLVARAYAPAVAALPASIRPASFSGRFPTSLGQVFLFAGIFVFPAYLLISLLLPYVCNRLQSGRRHLGLAYGANTLAFCLGMVAFTWLAPRVSIFYSMKLMMAVLAIGAGLLLLLREEQRLAAWKPILALASLGAACALTPAGFDRSYVTPGQPSALYPVRALKSNGAHTTYVVAAPDGDRLYFDNHSMSGTNHGAQVYMRLMAHFPLLAHADPQRVLLICFGVGNTAAAIASHDTVAAIDVVDLNDKVIATAPEFARYNGEVYLDPRVRFIHDDGRNFLNTTDLTYDLITSEPPPPMFTGVYRLYSREYYEEARAHLSEGGLMTQWLPVHEMPQEAVDLAVATFVEVFPHALLIVGHDTEYILVGCRSAIDLGRIEQRFEQQPAAAADLKRMGLRGPLHLLARVAKGEATLQREFGTRRTISDQHNDLTYLFQDPLASGVVSYDPLAMLTDVGAEQLALHAELRAVATHLGRLRYLADFPYDTLESVRPELAPGVALADLDWASIQSLRARCSELERAEDEESGAAADAARAQRLALLAQALALADEQPELLLELARAQANSGAHDAALTTLRRLRALEPEDPASYYQEGLNLLATQRFAEALAPLERAARIAPYDARTQFALGMARVSSGDGAGALEPFRSAVQADPEHVQARMQLGIALAQAGRLDEAIAEWTRALASDPQEPHLHHNLGLARKSRGEREAALEHFRDAVRVDPAFGQAHVSLGAALMEAQQLDEAVEHLRAALELDPNDADARRMLARARELRASAPQ